jgi:hypothetical protein
VDDSVDSQIHQVGHGLLVFPYITTPAFSERFPSDVPLPIMTLYYRLKGKPGDSGLVSFCDAVLELGSTPCNFNFIMSTKAEGAPGPQNTFYLSTANRAATLSVLDGPATPILIDLPSRRRRRSTPSVPPMPRSTTAWRSPAR